MESVQQVAALILRDHRNIARERVGKNVARGILVEPFDLAFAHQENAAQHQPRHALRMHGGVGERQRRTPRAAKDEPLLNAELLAHALNIGDEIPRRVFAQVRVRR